MISTVSGVLSILIMVILLSALIAASQWFGGAAVVEALANFGFGGVFEGVICFVGLALIINNLVSNGIQYFINLIV